MLYFVGALIQRLRQLFIQVNEYLLGHQRMFVRHFPAPVPTDRRRLANRLSCRFVDARYNLLPASAHLDSSIAF